MRPPRAWWKKYFTVIRESGDRLFLNGQMERTDETRPLLGVPTNRSDASAS